MKTEANAHPPAEKRRVEVYRAADAVDMALTGMRDGPEGAEVLEIRYGANKFKTTIPDASAKSWAAALEVARANAAQWREMDLSPTFAANRTQT